MKLTLQQLERSLQSGSDIREKISKAVISLLSQVNTLNDIASSFSSFAKMPEPEIQQLELIQLMKRIVDLHSQGGTIIFRPAYTEVFINGDEQLLGRIFSNLILNSFQASRPGVPLKIEIFIELDVSNVQIKFTDNGKGLDVKVLDRVFVPHFSTKRSGSGLGLAISKQGIEHMGGKIWFETKSNEGTTFFIELPRSIDSN
jgi:signal transduction histidine kinase